MKALINKIKSPQFKEAFKDYCLAVAASGVTLGVSFLLDFAPEYAVLIGAITADRKSTRLNSSHVSESRMPSSA